MYFQQMAPLLVNLPLFESGHLYASTSNPQQVQRQLADWVRAGKIVQLRRGLYTVAPPYQSEHPHSYFLDVERLTAYVERAGKPKLRRALSPILQLIEEELTEYVPLL